MLGFKSTCLLFIICLIQPFALLAHDTFESFQKKLQQTQQKPKIIYTSYLYGPKQIKVFADALKGSEKIIVIAGGPIYVTENVVKATVESRNPNVTVFRLVSNEKLGRSYFSEISGAEILLLPSEIPESISKGHYAQSANHVGKLLYTIANLALASEVEIFEMEGGGSSSPFVAIEVFSQAKYFGLSAKASLIRFIQSDLSIDGHYNLWAKGKCGTCFLVGAYDLWAVREKLFQWVAETPEGKSTLAKLSMNFRFYNAPNGEIDLNFTSEDSITAPVMLARLRQMWKDTLSALIGQLIEVHIDIPIWMSHGITPKAAMLAVDATEKPMTDLLPKMNHLIQDPKTLSWDKVSAHVYAAEVHRMRDIKQSGDKNQKQLKEIQEKIHNFVHNPKKTVISEWGDTAFNEFTRLVTLSEEEAKHLGFSKDACTEALSFSSVSD